jgi:tetratricopeptide (TPR) repeat protein
LALAQAQASSADKQARLDAAQHAINRALELNRAPLTVWIAYHIAMARNQTENIRSLGREAIDRDPTRPGEVARVSSWLLARGYSDDAMTVLSRAGRNAPEDSAKLALDLAQRLIAGAQKHTADRRVVALKQAMQLVDLSDKLSLQPENARPLRQRLEALDPASVQSATTSVAHPQVAPDSASTTNSVETVAQPSP